MHRDKGGTAMHVDDDKYLALKVHSSIMDDPGLRPYGIKVSSSKGVVRLQGIVDVFAEKMRAEDIAASVSGVTRIENNLTVSTDGRITDDDINFEVAEELRLTPNVDISKVYGDSKKGVVHLYGDVDSPDEAKAAIWAAAKARGVKDIVSHIAGTHDMDITGRTIPTPSESTVPEQAARELMDALGEYEASLPRPIRVSVKDGTIIMEGEVATLEQKSAIEKKARLIIEGYGRRVTGIDNRIILDMR
jgi:hyperosmotically inducible protein